MAIVANVATTLSLDTTDPVTFGDLIFTDLNAALTIDDGPSTVGFNALLFDSNIAMAEGDYTLLQWGLHFLRKRS